MRLPVCLLLVTLALCCFEANAVLCPSLATALAGYLYAPEFVLRIQLAKFHIPRGPLAAQREIKKCTDKISLGDRALLGKALAEVFLKCGAKDADDVISSAISRFL
ncbi:secretoglobin family 1D member 1-like [Cynocephalus volans]|uniref:secretoglobin family 1D member 1-like n=1 Tax=Cynocephalus volans TaxID=110931 RepID=UPI002FC73E1F